jgi:N-methylhydantoinase A
VIAADRPRGGGQLVGVDVGGTFTDIVAVDEESGDIRIFKVPSTPADQTNGILAGILALCGTCEGIRRVVHGTTVATNTVLEGNGAKVALLTTAGFRDTIEIGRCRRNVSGSMFNTKFVRPRPLVPRQLRFEVAERISYAGEILIPLLEREVEAVAARLSSEEIGALIVCFLHSYINPTHEERAKAILTRHLKDVFICTSAEILPELREFERFSTTAMNAYVAPVMRRYISNLRRQLKQDGYAADLYTMASNGGIMSSDTTLAYPVRTILSGPASGVNGAIFVGREVGATNLVTYDMGGTSTDVCLVENYQPLISTQWVFEGVPINTSQMEIHTVGAGGGSIAWVDLGGALRVGPRSAGASPGPACYGQGGDKPTVTDANLALGRLPEGLLDGTLPLSRRLAEEALSRLRGELGYDQDIFWLAEGIIKLSVATVASAIRKISIERGFDPREFTLVAGGGAGPMHAVQVAEELGIKEVLVPQWPGNLSALGLLTADLRHDYVATYLKRLSAVDRLHLAERLSEMETLGAQALREEGVEPRDIVATRHADMRMVGQAFELMVPLTDPVDLDALDRSFRQLYDRRYGHEHGEEAELVNLRVTCVGRTRRPELPKLSVDASRAAATERDVYFGGSWHKAAVIRRDALAVGSAVAGPAIVEEFGTTLVVPPGWGVAADPVGPLFVRRATGRGEAT